MQGSLSHRGWAILSRSCTGLPSYPETSASHICRPKSQFKRNGANWILFAQNFKIKMVSDCCLRLTDSRVRQCQSRCSEQREFLNAQVAYGLSVLFSQVTVLRDSQFRTIKNAKISKMNKTAF